MPQTICRIAFWSVLDYAAANALFFGVIVLAAVVQVPEALAVPWRFVLTVFAALGYAPLCVAGLLLGGAFGLRLARRAATPA